MFYSLRIEYLSNLLQTQYILTPDIELAKILVRCNSQPEHFSSLAKGEQIELRQYCNEIIKYNGIAHPLPGGNVFTDNTLLKPARALMKSLKRKKGESESSEGMSDKK